LTGTPYEVRPLAEAIARRGIRARGPLLPGHASSPEELVRLPRGAWLEAVRLEYARLRADHERVFVVGLSLGGLLSLALAQQQDVAGLVVVGTPLALRQPLPLLVPLLKRIVPMLPKRTGSDIRDPQARARHPGYDRMPLAAVHELIRLQRSVRSGLSRVTAPTLVAHGHHDSTARLRDAARIHREITARVREILILPSSAHVVPVDFDGPVLAEATALFVERYA
jgi:carboxylesterase